MEYTGAEEVSHVASAEPEREQAVSKEAVKVFPESTENGKPEPKPASHGNGRATQAQCRPLWTLTKKARYTEEDIESMLSPLEVSRFQDLPREEAYRLISYLQTEVAA